LELCQVFGTLIADADHIYDLATMDDHWSWHQGTLSVVELKVLKSRLLRGQEEKARRGELFRIVRRDCRQNKNCCNWAAISTRYGIPRIARWN